MTKEVKKANEEVKEEIKEEIKKQETKPVKKTPQPEKKETKNQAKKQKVESKELVYIDTFLDEMIHTTDLSRAKAVGFKAYMNGNHYAKDYKEFMIELENYLEKKVG